MNEFAAYVRHGWKLCSLSKGVKGPTYANWQNRPIAENASEGLDGAGLLHALSGTCALDLDAVHLAKEWLGARGIDLAALLDAPDAVKIDSGTRNHAKLLYRLKRPLRSLKPADSGLELRCATATGTSVQDALPPSTHPSGRLYEWHYGDLVDGHWSKLPAIPAPLLSLWRELAEPIREAVAPAPRASAATVDLVELRKAVLRHSPDCEFPEWIKVGMQLHEGTGGAQEGLDIWCAWSRGVKRIKYPGDEKLKSHWVSFRLEPGKKVVTAAALVAELPAAADEFPVETGAPAGMPTTEDEIAEHQQLTHKAAMTELEKRLVYVYSAEKYFDCQRHKLIGSDNAIDHMFGWLVTGRGGPVKALKKSRTKRFVDGLGFHPGAGAIFTHDDDSYANTYKDRLPEPLEPTKAERERIDWLFERIDDVGYRIWLKQFFGHVVQRPGVKIKSAPLIWSEEQGNGKTTLLKVIPSLLVGERYSKEVTSGLLNSDFNDYLCNTWHVNLTEFRAGTRGEREAITEKLKPWITDDTIALNPKGMPGYTMPNHFFVTATSNKDDAAAVDNHDRRWAIHEMHAPQFTESEQGWIYNEFLAQPRAKAVLRAYFLAVDLEGFSASAKAPDSEAKRDMAASSISSDVELLTIAFEQRSEPLERDVVLTHEVVKYVQKHTRMNPSMHRIGRMLSSPPFNGQPKRFWANDRSYRAMVIRDKDKWISAQGNALISEINGENVDLLV